MFMDKKSVDQHVAEVTSTYTEYEINLSSYYIARDYYHVGDYETAREYVLRYLKVQEASADAYKLLGEILDARDQKEAAWAKVKCSLKTDDKEVNSVHKRISGALFHVELLVHYIDNEKLEMGYKHAVDVEENHDFTDNLQWTQTVCRLLEMCKIMHSFDWKFWILYSSCLERLTKIYLKKEVDRDLPRFSPVIGNDIIFVNGWKKPISTRLHCVTCMKECDGKSMEEVRLEYYIAGCKLQTKGLGSPTFSFGAKARSTAFRSHALIKPSTAAFRATATTNHGFNLTPSTSTSQPFSQPTRPLLWPAAQSSDLGSTGTIQSPFKGFCANNTSRSNFDGGVQPNESRGALKKNNESVESATDARFSFGSLKSIEFGVSTAPKFGTQSLPFDQTNTSERFGNTNTIINSTGASELRNESWGNNGTTVTGVGTLGERIGVIRAEQDTRANQADQHVLDQLRMLSESKKILLKDIRTWQERVTSWKETVKHSKCELLSTVEAELLDGVELCNVSTREIDDCSSTEVTRTVATHEISVKAQQEKDFPKPKANDMSASAERSKTLDDVNFNTSVGQAQAGLLTSGEPAAKTEDSANIAEASKPQTKGFNFAFSSTTMPSFSFGTPATATQGLASNFKFKIPKSNSVAAAYSAKAPVGTISFGPTFGLGTPQNLGLLQNPVKPYAGLVLGSTGQSFSFQIPAKPTLKTPDGGKKSKHEVVESVDVHFAPVVPLPDIVNVETGEENEEILHSHRAKLFRYESGGKEWKERGLGDIKLLKHRESGKLRLLMRRDQVLKLCLNHIITPDLTFTPKDDRTWLWYAADYSTGNISHETFACRFRTAEMAQEFGKAINNARYLTKAPADKALSNSSSDIEIVYEAIVTGEEKAAALKLKLPENFYAYKKMPDCPGCIGCKDNQESALISKTAQVPKTVMHQGQ